MFGRVVSSEVGFVGAVMILTRIERSLRSASIF
jgi:hypothetical protein